jgi:hypothetical protein
MLAAPSAAASGAAAAAAAAETETADDRSAPCAAAWGPEHTQSYTDLSVLGALGAEGGAPQGDKYKMCEGERIPKQIEVELPKPKIAIKYFLFLGSLYLQNLETYSSSSSSSFLSSKMIAVSNCICYQRFREHLLVLGRCRHHLSLCPYPLPPPRHRQGVQRKCFAGGET